jgi:quinol monooxygenase YgiN
MAKLTIVAKTITKADKIDLVKAELLKLIDTTRAEEGCINYDLHQDKENPGSFESIFHDLRNRLI